MKNNELKQRGLISLIKNENGDVFEKRKRFNPETGDALEDVEKHINVNDLLNEKDTIEARLTEINELLADIDLVPTPEKVPVEEIINEAPVYETPLPDTI